MGIMFYSWNPKIAMQRIVKQIQFNNLLAIIPGTSYNLTGILSIGWNDFKIKVYRSDIYIHLDSKISNTCRKKVASSVR